MAGNGMKNRFSWIFFISRRINKVNRKGRTSVTSSLASLGIGFGVMSLIVVMSVMNGFQMSYIDSIMEISSYHARCEVVDAEIEESFSEWNEMNPNVLCTVPFYEAQGLMVSRTGRQSSAFVRAVPENVCGFDSGFGRELEMVSGHFDLTRPNSIIIGNTLAYELGVHVGSVVNIAALSGSSETALISGNRDFVVTGIFFCGYADINASFSFININDAPEKIGENAKRIYGVKLCKSSLDSRYMQEIGKKFPEVSVQSWREFNRSFFGALRIEKNMMFLLEFLIFIVVAVNIYNSIKRLVYERREDIAILSAFGSSRRELYEIFITQGFFTGIMGALPGLLVGVLMCVNMKSVFMFISKTLYFFQYAFLYIFDRSSVRYIYENPMFSVYASIPARMFVHEVMLIFLFGLFSSLFASFFASRGILKMSVAEVLKNE